MAARRLSLAEVMDGLRAYVAEVSPGALPVELRVILSTGQRIVLPVAAISVVAPAPVAELPVRRPGPEFRSVIWDNIEYPLTPMQGAVVKLLWEAWEDGTPDVPARTLLEAAESVGGRLRDVFRGNGVWNNVIVIGRTKGTFRLNVE